MPLGSIHEKPPRVKMFFLGAVDARVHGSENRRKADGPSVFLDVFRDSFPQELSFFRREIARQQLCESLGIRGQLRLSMSVDKRQDGNQLIRRQAESVKPFQMIPDGGVA